MWNLKHCLLTARDYWKCQLLFLSHSQCKDNFVLAPSENIRKPQGLTWIQRRVKKEHWSENYFMMKVWFLYNTNFRHERDKYEFHHRFSTVILIDAIQNKRQRMNVSTIQALRFDKLNLNLSKTTVSFWMLQFLISRKGKNLFNLNESMVPFLKAGIWNWRLLKGHTYLNIEKTIRYNSFKCFFTGFNAGIKWFQWN